ncbi:sulfurtransferase [Natrialbaceae archaeon AArc-T1-2]|uniref:sulfurtransferase n=1 Tax=Natrialbaceae archaeon AArc-T1-2 TaxID=3053904 RepID=UPI00255ACE6D|nr:rhodanese-like domain-containing protein [Natrialbaceae archaeon AArc-T1-2]WIV68202.1 rhodanese-like domain-containing protein [Natrialbaceae archaeon AArc-T1-2]
MKRRTFLVASGAAAVTASAGCLGDDGEPEHYSTPAAADLDTVVDVQWLEDNLDNVQPLDVRTKADFTNSRIEGAHFFGDDGAEDMNWARAAVETDDGYLPDVEAVAEGAERAGIGRNDDIVFYGTSPDHEVMRASVMFWAAGHEGNTYILDGGYSVWDEADLPTESGDKDHEGGSYDADDVEIGDLIVTHEWLNERIDEDGSEIPLIDARGRDEFLGNVDPGYHHTFEFERFGHIPGATNINHPQNGIGSGDNAYERLRSQEELEELYIDAAGLDPSELTVSYCVSGIRSSPGMFMLTTLGWDDMKMYEGSWRDWGNLPDGEYPYSQEAENIVEHFDNAT